MLTLDRDFLVEFGLDDLDSWDLNLLLRQVYESLEMRVGKRLGARMSEAQVEEFDVFFESKDEEGAFEWLQTNFPDYREVVGAEIEFVKAELREAALQIHQECDRHPPDAEKSAAQAGSSLSAA